MATCHIDGNSDMYGLGIRIGYYFQWYSVILAAWIAPDEVPSLRMALIFFSSATFLATVIQAAQRTLQSAEIYIILLLTFGSSFYLLPVFLWRLLTCFSSRLDPLRYPRAKPPGPMFNTLHCLVLIAVLFFQIWFWTLKVPKLEQQQCQEYGFLFAKVYLNSYWFRCVNIAIAVLLLPVVSVLFTAQALILYTSWKLKKPLAINSQGPLRRKSKVQVFQILESALNSVVATTIITSTELTIQWNEIGSVHSSSSAGQLIPLFLGIASFLRVIYLYYKQLHGQDEDNSEYLSVLDTPGAI